MFFCSKTIKPSYFLATCWPRSLDARGNDAALLQLVGDRLHAGVDARPDGRGSRKDRDRDDGRNQRILDGCRPFFIFQKSLEHARHPALAILDPKILAGLTLITANADG